MVYGTITGDVKTMKKEINEQERIEFRRYSTIYNVLLVMTMLLLIPLSKTFGWIGSAIWIIICAVTFYYGSRVEKYKKKHNIQTYKEIRAFKEGKTLSEIELAREEGKRPYQKAFITIGLSILAVVVTASMILIYRYL